MTLNIKKAFNTSDKLRTGAGLAMVALAVLMIETISRIYWVMDTVNEKPCVATRQDSVGEYCAAYGAKTFWGFNSLWNDFWANGTWWWSHFVALGAIGAFVIFVAVLVGAFYFGKWLIDMFRY